MMKYWLLTILILTGVKLSAQSNAPKREEPVDSAIIKAQADPNKAWMFKGTFVDSTSKRKQDQTPVFGSYKTNIIAGSIVLPVGLCGVAGGGIYYALTPNVDSQTRLKNTVGISVLGGGVAIVGAVLLGTGLRTLVLKNKSTAMNVGMLDSGGAGMLVQF